MNVYVFGNSDFPGDDRASFVADYLKDKLEDITFISVNPNEDLPFADEKRVIILDTVKGLNEIKIMGDEVIDRLVVSPRFSVHDFDLAFQLKYLKKLHKLGEVVIIGLPQKGELDYSLIKSIFKKLVAQDMQGS